MITIELNGRFLEVSSPASLEELVARALGSIPMPPTGVAAALNGAIVPRARWSVEVAHGDVVDVVHAVAGG